MIDEETGIRQLLDCLHPQGIRESSLKMELTKYADDLIKDLSNKYVSYMVLLT